LYDSLFGSLYILVMLFFFKNIVEGDVEQQLEGELDSSKLRTRMSTFGLYTFLSDISNEQKKKHN